jgi:hypothetical protein
VHRGNGEVLFLELGGEFIDLLLLVTVHDTLLDINVVVQFDEGIELPFFLINGNVELLDTVKGKFFILDQDSSGVSHEVLSKTEDFRGHGGGEEGNLDITGDQLEDFLNLFLETSSEHFISFIQNEELKMVSVQETSLEHVVDSTRSTDDDVNTFLELLSFVHKVGTTSTEVDLDVKVFTEAHYDSLDLLGKFSSGGKDESLASEGLRVNQLEDGDSEGSSLTGTRLSLSDGISVSEDGEDTLSLDDGGLDETVTVDASKKVGLKVKSVEGVDGFFPVGLDVSDSGLIVGGVHADCGCMVRDMIPVNL